MPHKLKFPLVFVDTEYTTFGATRETGRTRPEHFKEIVQIAAVKLTNLFDDTPKTFDVKIRPIKNPKLTNFFVNLTGLTQKTIDAEGVTFKEALDQFVAFSAGAKICTFDQDRHVFATNCEINGIENPFKGSQFFRIKGQLAKRCIDPDKYSSGTLYQAVGLDLHGHVHNALHDVISMSLFTQEMLKREKKN